MSIQPEERKSGGAPLWMCTFADMMSLLLTFFVLMLSMSNTELAKFRAMAGSLRSAFGVRSGLSIPPIAMSDEIVPHDDAHQGDAGSPGTGELARELTESLGAAGIDVEAVTALGDEDTVILRLESDLFFASGDATLKAEALPAIDAIASYIKTTAYFLDVVGHTDNLPIATSIYPTNWELSAARAGQAVRLLTERGVQAARLRAIGRADTAPIADNAAEAGRAVNRRVEFIFTRLRAPGAMKLPQAMEPPGQAADSER